MRGSLARRGAEIEVLDSDVVLERPRNRDHGDWATTIAMKLAKKVGTNPRELAEAIAHDIARIDGVASAEIAGPGFINIRLDSARAGALAKRIVDEGTRFGHGEGFSGIRINLEFVSANPTGPIHLGGVRWAAVGDSLARVLSFSGADVTREYYFNDHGAQIDRFASSLVASYLGEPTPEDGYGGAYIGEIQRRVATEHADELAAATTREAQQEIFRRYGVEQMFDEIKQAMHDFRVDFDVYFHEDSVHRSGAVERAIEQLRETGHVYEKDGAQWLRTTEYGDDKDRVIVRSNGMPAYMSGDIGYYLNKRERGFDRQIIMLGADHHGYVGRMMAMVAAFGDTPGVSLSLLIGQMVNLVRDGKPVRMSKRAGTIVTIDDLVDAVGVDAARYALTRSSANTPLDIDLDQLVKRSNDNPVFYVQYAHARTRQVANNAREAGVDAAGFDPATLSHESEAALLGGLEEFPRIVAQAAELSEPHRIARYLEEIAGLYHRWYDSCRVVPQGDDEITAANQSRLVLNNAVGVVLRNGLDLLGVTAPDRM